MIARFPTRSASRRWLAMASLGLALALGGCLRPVHAPQLGGGPSASLSGVSLEKVDGYLGHILYTELGFLLGSAGGSGASTHLLSVRTQRSRAASLIDAATGLASSATLQVEAVYELRDTRAGKVIANGKVFASGTYERSQLRFNALRAEREAEERVAKLLAERLRAVVIAALNNPSAGPVGPTPRLSPASPVPGVIPGPDTPAPEPGSIE